MHQPPDTYIYSSYIHKKGKIYIKIDVILVLINQTNVINAEEKGTKVNDSHTKWDLIINKMPFLFFCFVSFFSCNNVEPSITWRVKDIILYIHMKWKRHEKMMSWEEGKIETLNKYFLSYFAYHTIHYATNAIM